MGKCGIIRIMFYNMFLNDSDTGEYSPKMDIMNRCCAKCQANEEK
jgi:hypothetical protein